MTGILILCVAVVAATAFGLRRRSTDGRFTPTQASPTWALVAQALPAAALGHGLGARATLVQFSSAFCAPCRTTRVVLGDIAANEAGVSHLEVDAEAHLDLVRALDIRRTPTTLILGPDGHELLRAAGAPHRAQVLSVLPEAASS